MLFFLSENCGKDLVLVLRGPQISLVLMRYELPVVGVEGLPFSGLLIAVWTTVLKIDIGNKTSKLCLQYAMLCSETPGFKEHVI